MTFPTKLKLEITDSEAIRAVMESAIKEGLAPEGAAEALISAGEVERDAAKNQRGIYMDCSVEFMRVLTKAQHDGDLPGDTLTATTAMAMMWEEYQQLLDGEEDDSGAEEFKGKPLVMRGDEHILAVIDSLVDVACISRWKALALLIRTNPLFMTLRQQLPGGYPQQAVDWEKLDQKVSAEIIHRLGGHTTADLKSWVEQQAEQASRQTERAGV